LPSKSSRLNLLPPYLFARLDAKKAEALESGVDVIDMGVGDPDLPSPNEVVEALCEAVRQGEYHRYPPYSGTGEFRRAWAEWLLRRHGVSIDPDTEALALIGSKEGLAHLCLAVVNPGDVVLYPDPGYPVYRASAVLAGGEPFAMPLLAERGYMADLSAIPQRIAESASLMFLNYPNNPTGATATPAFLNEVVGFARANDIAVCHDAAYIDMVLDGGLQPCLLAASEDKTNLIEFFSFSKTFNMAGWRIALAAGDRKLIAALGQVKRNLDSGVFLPIQAAATEAIRHCEQFPGASCAVYRERLEMLLPALAKAGLKAERPRATFYVWAAVPGGLGSGAFAEQLLSECAILVAPGVAFGSHGEGYVRFSLTLPTERVREAARRLSEISL